MPLNGKQHYYWMHDRFSMGPHIQIFVSKSVGAERYYKRQISHLTCENSVKERLFFMAKQQRNIRNLFCSATCRVWKQTQRLLNGKLIFKHLAIPSIEIFGSCSTMTN